jgi:hypothetical protein
VFHQKIPRGSRFLKDGSVLLPDQQLLPYRARLAFQALEREIKNLPEYREAIPTDQFVRNDIVLQTQASKKSDSKN